MNKPFTVIGDRCRLENHDNSDFPEGVTRIIKYSFSTSCVNSKKRVYIVEIHEYDKVAMLKFYPRCHKNNSRKYELRGLSEVGYRLPRLSFFYILSQCSDIMQNYLDKNQNNYIGYVGQVDKIDNKRKKATSQRSDVYNFILTSIIDHNRYKFITRKAFEEINMRLIRKNLRKDNSQTAEQKEIYSDFIQKLKKKNKLLLELMTDKTKAEITSRGQ